MVKQEVRRFGDWYQDYVAAGKLHDQINEVLQETVAYLHWDSPYGAAAIDWGNGSGSWCVMIQANDDAALAASLRKLYEKGVL